MMASEPQSPKQPSVGFSSAEAEWEAAGTRLASAMFEYLDSCIALDRACATPRTLHERQNLAAVISQGILALDISADQPLGSAYNVLDRILKRTTSPALLLPPEILTRIFELAAHREPTTGLLPHVAQTDINIVECLSLVCTYWREVALEIKSLWSVVYLTGNCSLSKTQLWLERSGDASLDLMGNMYQYVPWLILPVISPHASRFSTLNLMFPDLETIHIVLNCWLEHGAPGSVTELSVRCAEVTGANRDPPEFTHLFGPTPLSEERRDEYLKPLRVLRLKDVWLDWDSVAFQGLVELRLEVEHMHANSYVTVGQLSRILSACPELHTLELVGIVIDLGEPNEAVPPTSIVLPKLRTLYLQGIKLSSLDAFLSALAPGSYDIELDLTLGDTSDVSTDEFQWQLPPHLGANVAMLCLGKILPEQFRNFLCSLPRLHTLYLHQNTWLTETILQAMTRLVDTDTAFPNLHSLHIFRGVIFDVKMLQDMVASHSIKKLTLGGQMLNRGYDGDVQSAQLNSDDAICQQLAVSIPEFVFHYSSYVNTTLELMPRRHWRIR